jgi:hypothetical protein
LEERGGLNIDALNAFCGGVVGFRYLRVTHDRATYLRRAEMIVESVGLN